MSRQKLRTLNTGNLMVLVGLGWLGFGLWMPYATAHRVFRIEERARRTTSALHDVLQGRTDWDLQRAGIATELAGAANAALGQTDPESSLYLTVVGHPPQKDEPLVVFEDKHYLYMVTRTPLAYLGVEVPVQRPGAPQPAQPQPPPQTVRAPFEVYAWPLKRNQGAQSVFFQSTASRAAFTRNLAEKYVGLERAPDPGAGSLHHADTDGIYYGQDEARWQYLDPPASPESKGPASKGPDSKSPEPRRTR